MKNSEFPEKAFETYINHFLLEEGFNLYIPSQVREAKLAYDALINNLKSKTGRIIPIAFQYKIVSEYAVHKKAKNFKFDLLANKDRKTKITKYAQHNILFNKNRASKYFAAGYIVPYFVTYDALYENIDKNTLLKNSYFIRPQHKIPDGPYAYHYYMFDKITVKQHSSEPLEDEIISLRKLLNKVDNAINNDYAVPIESFIQELTTSILEFNNPSCNTKEYSKEFLNKVYPIIAYKVL